MGKIKTYIKSLLTAALSLGMATRVLALEVPKITQETGTVDPIEIIEKIGDWMIGLAATLGVVFLIYGGIKYITGGAKAAEEAKTIIINSIIGLVVVALSYVLVKFVFQVIQG